MLRYGRNQRNIVKQVSSCNKKKSASKLEIKKLITFVGNPAPETLVHLLD